MAARRDTASRDLFLDLIRIHDALVAEFHDLFRAHGLTMAWFNVLRILRGASAEGLACQEVGRRLVQRVPDVTRLVDRMEAAGLVRRARSAEDRRVVRVLLTPEGLSLCDDLDEPVLELHAKQLAHLPVEEIRSLDQGLRAILSS